MKSSRLSWQEKLDKVQECRVVVGEKRFVGKRMVLPTPRQIEALVQEIPSGAVSTPKLIGQTLATRLGADITCPLCTGMFLRIVAEAANEQQEQGIKNIAPYWRVIDKKGRNNPMYPGGEQAQSSLRESELANLILKSRA